MMSNSLNDRNQLSTGSEIEPRRSIRSFAQARLIGALFTFVATFGFVVTGFDDYGFAVDEATYVWVADECADWFSHLGRGDFKSWVDPAIINEKCHFLESPAGRPVGRHSNFNLPASTYVALLGRTINIARLPRSHADRIGSAFLFSSGVALTFATLSRGRTIWHGVLPAAFILLSPRLLGHAHLIGLETSLNFFWIALLLRLATSTDRPTTNSNLVALFVFAGLTASTKLTGWFAVPACLLWLAIYRPSRWLSSSIAVVVGAGLGVWMLTPNLWRDPIGQAVEHLGEAAANPWSIPTCYRGTVYAGDLPIESMFIHFGVTSPAVTLILGVLGLSFFHRRPTVALFGLNMLVVLGLRLAGKLPGHDVERQFLPALAFLAVVAGLTSADALESIGRRFQAGRWIAAFFALGLMFEPAVESWNYRRNGLSYFNTFIGGIEGADRAGFETGYWFEGISRRDWIAVLDALPEGATVFLRPDHPGFSRQVEELTGRTDLKLGGPEARYRLFYAKPSAYAVPVPPSNSGRKPTWIMTDLRNVFRTAPAKVEVSFRGVRIAALIDTGR